MSKDSSKVYLKNGMRVLGVECEKCGHETSVGDTTAWEGQLGKVTQTVHQNRTSEFGRWFERSFGKSYSEMTGRDDRFIPGDILHAWNSALDWRESLSPAADKETWAGIATERMKRIRELEAGLERIADNGGPNQGMGWTAAQEAREVLQGRLSTRTASYVARPDENKTK